MNVGASLYKSDAVTPRGAAASLILDEGHRHSGLHRFFRAVRVSLSGPIDSSAFQEVSLGREVSIIFTSSGPLIYRSEKVNNRRLGEIEIDIACKLL